MRLIESMTLVALGLMTAISNADTIYVCWDGSGDYLTIQEGIDAATDGDEVVVCDGTYTGPGNKNLDFGGKLITVRSENGPETCIIDCQHEGRGFYFHSGDTAKSVVDGFTITNGDGGVYGGAVCCGSSDPTLTNCVFSGNTAMWGGGMYNGGGRPTLTNCVFSGNTADVDSGGMCNDNGGEPTLTNCTFRANTATWNGGGMSTFYDSTPKLTNCVFSGNTAYVGGGMRNHYSNPTLINCTFSGNTANDEGGGLLNEDGSPTLVNCILWGDTPDEVHVYFGGPTITYCNVEGGWTGEGNIDADPLFVDPDGPDDDPNTWEDNDYHLSPGSPSIDHGCNVAVPPDSTDLDGDGDTAEQTPLDLDGEGRFFDDPNTPNYGCCGQGVVVDMGAYEYGGTGPQPCPGDLDGDQDIDHADLGFLLSCWGCDCGDLDCSGHTDQADLGILLAHWGEVCP